MKPTVLELVYTSSSLGEIQDKEDELVHLADSLFEGCVDIYTGTVLDHGEYKLQFRAEKIKDAECECKTD